MTSDLAPFLHALDALRRPFRIGLEPIAPERIFQTDADRSAQLALKHSLLEATPQQVFAALPGWEAAQREVEALVRTYAPSPPVNPLPQAAPPLLSAALRVQEDLLLMAREAATEPYRLVAGSLSFPSSWSLAEKIGRPMPAIHATVPDFAEASRNDALVSRIYAALQPMTPVERHGWSIYPDGALPHPPGAAKTAAAILGAPHLRLERQTLTKLPETGAILFTVRLHIRPLETIERSAPLATALAEGLEALSPEALAYKGLTEARPALVARLRQAAAL